MNNTNIDNRFITIKNKNNYITNISHAIDLVREEMGNDTADLFQFLLFIKPQVSRVFFIKKKTN